eukprot:SM000300S11719  [mRNA]  locus=s300:55588:56525:- [translate_table: standard]
MSRVYVGNLDPRATGPLRPSPPVAACPRCAAPRSSAAALAARPALRPHSSPPLDRHLWKESPLALGLAPPACALAHHASSRAGLCTEREMEDEFRVYGVLRSVWVARKPPGFAFIEFEDRRDAEDAIKGSNGDRSLDAPAAYIAQSPAHFLFVLGAIIREAGMQEWLAS